MMNFLTKGMKLTLVLACSFTTSALLATDSRGNDETPSHQHHEMNQHSKSNYLRTRSISVNDNYCGTSFTNAQSKCGQQCPNGNNGECPLGEKCYGGITTCSNSSPPPAPTTIINTNYCGTSWTDAKSKCDQECPSGFNIDCPLGERCFGGVETCARPSVALCHRSKDLGFPVPQDDSRILDDSYSEPVYSDVTSQEVTTAFSEEDANSVVGTIGNVLSQAATIAGAFEWQTAMKALSTAGPVLSAVTSVVGLVFSLFGGGGKSAVELLIEEKFDELFDKLDDLEEFIGREFHQVKKQIGDQTLDEFTSSLQAISHSYKNLQLAAKSRNENLPRSIPNLVVKDYFDQFRAACNVPHRRPQDIFRDLYGYACGDKGTKYVCDSTDWGNCKHGTKKEQFLLDIYLDFAQNDVEKIKGFNFWLRSAMYQAAAFYNFCPSLEVSCVDPATDPVAKAERDMMLEAFNEVNFNLDQAVTCFQDNPTKLLTMEFLMSNVNYHECSNVTPAGGQQNGCIAARVLETLQDNDTFDKYEWLVVVYLKDSCVAYDGEQGSNAGYYHTEGSDKHGIMDKKFHFMYHKKGFNAKKKMPPVLTVPQYYACFNYNSDSHCHQAFYNSELYKGFGYMSFTNCNGNNRGTTWTWDFQGNAYFSVPNKPSELGMGGHDWIY